MLQAKKELEAQKSKISGALSAAMAVMLMVGLSQTGCVLEALLGAVARVAMGLLPEVLLKGWYVLQAAHSSGNASVCGEVVRIAGSWWPMLANLIIKI